MASNEPVSRPSPSAKSTPIAAECWPSIGPVSPAMTTSEASQSIEALPTLFAEDFHVNRTRQPLEVAISRTTASGQRCCALFQSAGPLGSLVRTLLTSTDWHSDKWWLTWKGSDTRSRRRLRFRLVPSDTITGGRASGLSATPTAKANQLAPSMQKWPGCRQLDITPEAIEIRMGYPVGWTALED